MLRHRRKLGKCRGQYVVKGDVRPTLAESPKSSGITGPSQQSVAFLGGGGTWYHIDPAGDYTVQTDNLEKMKTYEWGLDLATAYYDFTNVTWISTTIDLGYGYDRWSGSNTADYYNRFTTGN